MIPKGNILLSKADKDIFIKNMTDLNEYIEEQLRQFPVSIDLRSIKVKQKKIAFEKAVAELDFLKGILCEHENILVSGC